MFENSAMMIRTSHDEIDPPRRDGPAMMRHDATSPFELPLTPFAHPHLYTSLDLTSSSINIIYQYRNVQTRRTAR